MQNPLDKYKKLKIMIAVPSMGQWFTDFSVAFNGMFNYCGQRSFQGFHPEHQVTLNSLRGSMLGHMRRDAVILALREKYTHILWVDSDHTFPPQMLHRLVDARRDVVAVNHVTKQIPATPTARGWPTEELPGGPIVYTYKDSPEYEKVWRVGCGTVLVRTKVYEKTGPNIFDMVYDPRVDQMRGEDWSMMEAIEKAGFDIWIDHRLSPMCYHIGYFAFGHDMVEAPKRETNLEVVNG